MSEYQCEIDGCSSAADLECRAVDRDGDSATVFCCSSHKKEALVRLGVDEYYAAMRIVELNEVGGAENE